jgi:hypothetical protein
VSTLLGGERDACEAGAHKMKDGEDGPDTYDRE